MDYAETMERIAQGFEVAGVAIIVIGGVVAPNRAHTVPYPDSGTDRPGGS